jgi:hypothetical protein
MMLDTTLSRVRPPGTAFRDTCESHASATALTCGGRSWSFERLWQDSARAGAALARRGSPCRIASWSPNAAEAVIAQWGAILAGAQTIHLDPDWDAGQAHAVLRGLSVDWLFARAFHRGRQYPAMIKAVRAECPGLGDVITHGREPRFERALRGGWLDFLDSGDAAALPADDEAVAPVVDFFEPAEAGGASRLLAGFLASDDRPVCMAVPCWQPAGLGLLLHAQLRGRAVVLMGEDSDPFEIANVARQANCGLAVVNPATAHAAHAAGLDDPREGPRFISPPPSLAEEVDGVAPEIGLVFRTLSNGATGR